MKKMSVRIEDKEHKLIMLRLIQKDISFNQYVLDLIRKDLKLPSK